MNMRTTNRQLLGKHGEDVARQVVTTAGLIVVAQNVHTRYGELDIIAHDGTMLHIIEVKTRTSDRYGSPEQAITTQKLAKMRRAVSSWQNQTESRDILNRLPRCWQIDIIAITLYPSKHPTITWYKNVGKEDVT